MCHEFLTINELSTGSYMERTRFNATTSDMTAACALDFTTAGERHTKMVADGKYVALNLSSPAIVCARILYRELVIAEAKVLNLAGNGMHILSKKNVSQRRINLWVHDVLALINAHYPIQLKSGGQTGVDITAAVVGPLLHIQTEINFPKGFMQRNQNGIDFMQSQDEVIASIIDMRAQLVEDLKSPTLKN